MKEICYQHPPPLAEELQIICMVVRIYIIGKSFLINVPRSFTSIEIISSHLNMALCNNPLSVYLLSTLVLLSDRTA
jgi:hypothetical protein